MGFQDFFQQYILEHNELQMSKLFKVMKKAENPLTGVHFSKTSTFSLRMKPFHYDPVALYVFPKDYILNGGLKKNAGFAKLPYMFIVEPTEDAKILNLDMDENFAKGLLTTMDIPLELWDSTEIFHNSNMSSAGHRFWGVLEHWRHKTNASKNASWNALFKKAGYNTLYDPGKAIIHSNEPEQVAYLEKSAFKIVDIISNDQANIVEVLKNAFPDFKINNQNRYSNKQFKDSLEYYFQNPDGNYFSLFISKNNNTVSVLVNSNHRKSYDWDGDSKTIIEDIKELLTKEKQEYPVDKSDNSLLGKIAKEYHLAWTPNSNRLERNYVSKNDPDYKMVFTLNYGAKSKYSEEDITIVMQRRYIKSHYGVIGNYHYFAKLENPSELSPGEIIRMLFGKLEKAIEKDFNDGGGTSREWENNINARRAIHDIGFLKRRIFQIKDK